PGADRKARIAAQIAELDQVTFPPDETQVVQALLAGGDDAVVPLIDASEHDKRLTRSVDSRSMHPPGRFRTIATASNVEYSLACGLLKTSSFGPGGIRAYWEKYRNVPLIERWYRTLAAAGASPERWYAAAENIVRRDNVIEQPSNYAFR